MSYEQSLTCITLPANADLSSSQFLFCTATNSGGKARAAVAGDGVAVAGVIQNDPDTAGDATTVAIAGVSKVVAGGSITAGNLVASDAAGKAAVATSGEIVAGIALASADASDIIPVLLVRGHIVA